MFVITRIVDLFVILIRRLRVIGVIYRYIVYPLFFALVVNAFTNLIYYGCFVRLPHGQDMIAALQQLKQDLLQQEAETRQTVSLWKRIKTFIFTPY